MSMTRIGRIELEEIVLSCKPVTELTEAEIARLSPELQTTVRNHLKEKRQ